MRNCRQRISQGFQLNKDITPIFLHTSIGDLFDTSPNYDSACLSKYEQLLPHISTICNGPKNQADNSTTFFESSISTKSARGRIKSFCGELVTNQIYSTMNTDAPEHTHSTKHLVSANVISINRNESKQSVTQTTQLVLHNCNKTEITTPNL